MLVQTMTYSRIRNVIAFDYQMRDFGVIMDPKLSFMPYIRVPHVCYVAIHLKCWVLSIEIQVFSKVRSR